MIYRMLKQIGGLLIGALMMLAILWSWPTVMAFPAAAPPVRPATIVVQDALAATQVLQYQGRLVDAVTGQQKPDGAYAFSFRIYNTATAGTPLWTETKSITVNKGLFSTLLGDSTPLEPTLFNGQELYLGVTVGTDPEAAPRQRLAHVAYAFRAETAATATNADHATNADQLNGQSATAYAPATHTHSGEQITAGTVADARIADTLTRDTEVLPIVLAGDGSGSGLNADTLDGYDQSSFYKGASGIQVNEVNALAAGASAYYFTFGYSADQLVVWRVKPTVVGAKMRLEVETELSTNNTVTYWLRVYNTGTVASGFQLIRQHFSQ